MAVSGGAIDVTEFINSRKISRFQAMVVALCALTVFLDGFDVQSVAFVAPSLVADWHIERSALGPIFSASTIGLMVGALFFGPLADKIGRRWVLIICALIFGGCTLLTAVAENVQQLLIFRVIAGLGLGGAMPNAIAMTAEYCPQNRRATMVMIMFTGFSLGAGVGGAIAGVLIPYFGWRSVWYVGGVLPLLLVPLLYFTLPESLRFLVVTKAARDKVASLIQRIDRQFVIPKDAQFEIGEVHGPGVPVVQLLKGGRATGTILLWTMFFMNLFDLYLLQSWIPTILRDMGISLQTAVWVGALFQFGGVAAAVVAGIAIDRLGAFKVLPVLYVTGCVLIILLGNAGTSVPLLALLTFGAGFCVVGAQNSANAIAAMFYPTSMRSSGVGWSLGIGRIGAFLGPLIVAQLVAMHWSNESIFLVGSIPVFVASIASIIMGRLYKVS
jgi:AAHS family 4-hydroxybenzoate transporter-like MFS transporter